MENASGCNGNLCGLRREDFRKEINGKQTDLYILRNRNGMEMAVTNFGAVVLAIMVPDRNGKYANVILGHDHINKVVDSPEPYLNSTIGRYGNRIARGKFTLDGKEYVLSVNNGPNSLHGGPNGFHRVIWDSTQTNSQCLELKHTSVHMEEGFPGNVTVEMTYILSDDNAFIIQYKARTDRKTILNLTHHGFYNLAGTGCPAPSIENHILTIYAHHYIPIDEVSIPTGEILKAGGTPMDFLTPRTVGSRINEPFEQLIYGAGYDHCYVLDKKEPGELSLAATCVEPESGRTMEVFTTEPGLQFYTGNWLSGFGGAHGATFPARSAICLEAQHFPDTPNRPYFLSCILKPEEEYTQTTLYKFGVAS